MAYAPNNLSVLAYANSFTFWHYTTIDLDVTTPGYFNLASEIMNVGDLVITNMDTNGTPITRFYVVTENTGSTVTITQYS